MTDTILLVLKLSVVTLIFGIGLGSTANDLAYLWHRPRQLVRSLVAMYVVVPLVLLLLTKVLPMTTAVRTAVLVLAVSAGAPLLPKKLMKLGREGYVFSLVVTSSLVAIVAVPLWVETIAAVFGRDAQVDPLRLAALIAKAFLGPLLLGMAARRLIGSGVRARLRAPARARGHRPGDRGGRAAGPARRPARSPRAGAPSSACCPMTLDRAHGRTPDGRPRSRRPFGAGCFVRDPARGGRSAGGVGGARPEDGRVRDRLRADGGNRLRRVPALAVLGERGAGDFDDHCVGSTATAGRTRADRRRR